ncbi:MAG: R3H domain-containing nucleic acid-binding protein [Candidatus Shapirobacteria bacterium]
MENQERNEKILKISCGLLEKMGLAVESAFVEDVADEENNVLVGVTVNNPGSLIGFKGRNLAAVQLVLGLMVKNQLGEWVKVLLDVNNYRAEQKTRLETMAVSLANKAKETGKMVAMVPMSAYERRICHMAVADIEGISSESEGEGEERHIVIRPIEVATE